MRHKATTLMKAHLAENISILPLMSVRIPGEWRQSHKGAVIVIPAPYKEQSDHLLIPSASYPTQKAISATAILGDQYSHSETRA